MSSKSISGDLISNRYASALYDLAADLKIVDSIFADLQIIENIIETNKDFKLLIQSPLIASNDKYKIIEKILSKNKINKLTINFLNVIKDNKRFSKLFSIVSEFKKINMQKRGDILADVISAENLSDDQKKGINTKLKSILGEKLLLNFNVDKKIIGGLIVKVGSKMIDSSLKSKFNKLNIAMKEV